LAIAILIFDPFVVICFLK